MDDTSPASVVFSNAEASNVLLIPTNLMNYDIDSIRSAVTDQFGFETASRETGHLSADELRGLSVGLFANDVKQGIRAPRFSLWRLLQTAIEIKELDEKDLPESARNTLAEIKSHLEAIRAKIEEVDCAYEHGQDSFLRSLHAGIAHLLDELSQDIYTC